MAEKIYLQLGTAAYTTDQTIWFKAIVTDAENHLPSELSGVLYVDLISPSGQILEHKLVKLEHGIGNGFFDLQDSYAQGRYLIRAYTQWNRNFGMDFFFKTYLNVYASSHLQNKHPLGNLAVKKKENGSATLSGNLNDSLPDVQFFPESGRLVHGFRNKIGFKAVGPDGKGFKIWGTIFDASGNRITDFESNHLGMGVFSVEADSSASYRAKISLSKEEKSSFTYSLPKVVAKGSILSLDKAKDKIRIRVASNHSKDRVYIKVSCRGKDYYMIEGPLSNGYLTSELPSNGLPGGIILFTLLDSNKKPIAERLFFNDSEQDELNIVLDTDKTVYGRREETKLDIQVSGSDSTPPPIDLSVLVVNKEHRIQATGGNIRSYFLLGSELRGEVEEADYYFNEENSTRFDDLDALLLTQGWRNYKYPAKRKGRPFFWPEPGLVVKGKVRSTGGKDPTESIDLTLATFGNEPTFYAHRADSMGRFNFLLNDSYGQRMRIFLNAKEAEHGKKNYSLSIDSFSAPDVNYEPKPALEKPTPVEKEIVAAKERRDKTEMVFGFLYGVTRLEEVVVEDYRLTPERKRAYEKFGEPDVVIRGDSIRKKEKKWSYGLYSILQFNYGDQVSIEQFPDGFMLAHINGGRGEPTLLMVDGKLLEKWQYESVPHMPPGIVEDVELIKYAKFFKRRYLTVFPETGPLEAPSLGHIISIYTKGGVGIHGTEKTPPGMLDTTMDIFSPIKEFYAPKYDQIAKDVRPDLRSLVHWVPSLETDQAGVASASFYNGDIIGDYIIIVEAISSDGRIGYGEMIYHVGNEDP